MDTTYLRIAVTVLGFVCFLGICFWAYSRHAKKGFEEAAQLPFTEDEFSVSKTERSEKGKDNG